jgi:hypothetical protein
LISKEIVRLESKISARLLYRTKRNIVLIDINRLILSTGHEASQESDEKIQQLVSKSSNKLNNPILSTYNTKKLLFVDNKEVKELFYSNNML